MDKAKFWLVVVGVSVLASRASVPEVRADPGTYEQRQVAAAERQADALEKLVRELEQIKNRCK